jgi:hypothetical protein
MKITVKYGDRWFGNDFPSPDFTAHVKRNPFTEGVNLELVFVRPQAGRGANWSNKGFVSGANLILSLDEARALAAALHWHLDGANREDLELQFGKAGSESA